MTVPLMLEFLKALFLTLHFSYHTLITFLMMLSVTFLSMLDDTTLYCRCDQASILWQQVEMAAEFGSNLQDTGNCGRKWLVDFNAGKAQLISFD